MICGFFQVAKWADASLIFMRKMNNQEKGSIPSLGYITPSELCGRLHISYFSNLHTEVTRNSKPKKGHPSGVPFHTLQRLSMRKSTIYLAADHDLAYGANVLRV
jgi:hypothetical protein